MTNQTEPGILFIDDDIEITRRFQNLFSNHFIIHTVNDPAAGFKIFEENHIGLVMADHYMPEMTGIEFLKIILKKNPSIRRILFSGQMDVNIAMESIDVSGVHKIMVKPFNPDQLMEEINLELDNYKSSIDFENHEEKLQNSAIHLLDLITKQSKDLFQFFKPIWNKENKMENTRLINIVETLIKYSIKYVDLYFQKSNEYFKAKEYFDQNLNDLELISIEYNQLYLQKYVLLLNIYDALIEEEFAKANRYYYDLLISSKSKNPNFDKFVDKYRNALSTIEGDFNRTFDEDILDAKMINNFQNKIKNLLEFEIINYIKVEQNYLEYKLIPTKFYLVSIMEEETIIYLNDRLSVKDTTKLNPTIDILQTLYSEFNKINEKIMTIQMDGVAIFIQIINNIKYILITSKKSIESFLKFNKFVLETSKDLTSIMHADDTIIHNKLNQLVFEIFEI